MTLGLGSTEMPQHDTLLMEKIKDGYESLNGNLRLVLLTRGFKQLSLT